MSDLSVFSELPDDSGDGLPPSRREFIRKVGQALFALTLVDIADPTGHALAQSEPACGNGVADSACDPAGNCIFGDTSNTDDNCNVKLTGTQTVDQDNSCSATEKDDSCRINQLPNNKNYETDEQCTAATNTDPDNSCGDCDDNHESDEHCGKTIAGQYDPDGLCGHQHGCAFGVEGGITTDQVCGKANPGGGAGVVSDVGCGTHGTGYGGSDKDNDESCNKTQVGGGGNNPDMNCGDAGETADDYCNTAGNASTTSPDEHCGDLVAPGGALKDADQACSHYDADESCGKQKAGATAPEEDEACGITTIDYIPDVVDPDGYCPGGNVPTAPKTDADDVDEENKQWPIPKSTYPVTG